MVSDRKSLYLLSLMYELTGTGNGQFYSPITSEQTAANMVTIMMKVEFEVIESTL